MKKLLTAMLCIPLCFSAVAFSACNDPDPEYEETDYFTNMYELQAEYYGEEVEISNPHDSFQAKSKVRIISISGKVFYNPTWYEDRPKYPTEDWMTDTFVDNFTVKHNEKGWYDFVMTPASNPELPEIVEKDEYIRIQLSQDVGYNFGVGFLEIDFEPLDD